MAKSDEELEEIRQKIEELRKKLQELSEDELKSVTGGLYDGRYTHNEHTI